MNILLLQMDIEWRSPDDNRRRIENIIDRSSKSDLVILPEMFTTGFCASPENVAEKADGLTLKWLQNTAKEKDTAIAGSIAIEENGKYYNRFYFVKPDSSYSVYNKRHLFSFVGENKTYTSGDKRVIVEYKEFRILLQICYDIRFPVFSRNRLDYDMIIYVANWPVPRIDAWNTLLSARAIENQCYVAGVNRTGNDPSARYNGGTALIDFRGKPIASAASESEEAVLGTANICSLNNFREKFPALADADIFTVYDLCNERKV